MISCSNVIKSFLSKPLSVNKIAVIIESSNHKYEGFAENIENTNSKLLLLFHTNCNCPYTSKSSISQHMEAKKMSEAS